VFVQITVVPTETSSWAGLKALLPRVDAPIGIVMGVDPAGVGAGVGVGVGTGDGPEYPLPHAVASSMTANTKVERNDNINPPDQSLASKRCESPRDFAGEPRLALKGV
jgi:hypothetical protein